MREFEYRHPLEREPNDPAIRAVHGVPLKDLLGNQDRTISIVNDSVSIYAMPKAQGTEYAVVFPTLDGSQLYERLTKIARVKPGIFDVQIDIGSILHYEEGPRAKSHARNLGILWETFYSSLPHQYKVFKDADDLGSSRQKRLAVVKNTATRLEAYKRLSELRAEPFAQPAEEQMKAVAMLAGETPADADFLTKFFQLHPRELAIALKYPEKNNLKGKINRFALRKIQGMNAAKLAPLARETARRKVQKEYNDGKSPYDERKLRQYAKAATDVPDGTSVFYDDQGFYTIPNYDSNLRIEETQSGQRLTLKVNNTMCSFHASVDDGGKFIFGEEKSQLQATLERLQQETESINLVVPIIRFQESRDGVRGFVFNDTGGSLPQAVIDDIGKRVDTSRESSLPFQPTWISDMVGVDMLLAAHPSVRTKNDEWSKVWQKQRITYSEVMGNPPKPNETTQFNGPVQIGIIALHAMSRYPDAFDTFIERVKEAA